MKIEVVDFGLLHADQKQKIYKLKSENIESFNMDRSKEDYESIYYRGLSEINESYESLKRRLWRVRSTKSCMEIIESETIDSSFFK